MTEILLEGFYERHNRLTTPISGRFQGMTTHRFKKDQDGIEKDLLEKELFKRFGDDGDALCMAINEVLVNYKDGDTLLRYWSTDTHLCAAISGEKGFDPALLDRAPSFTDRYGDAFKHHPLHFRRWGDEWIRMHVDYVSYDPDMKGVTLVKELKKAA